MQEDKGVQYDPIKDRWIGGIGTRKNSAANLLRGQVRFSGRKAKQLARNARVQMLAQRNGDESVPVSASNQTTAT